MGIYYDYALQLLYSVCSLSFSLFLMYISYFIIVERKIKENIAKCQQRLLQTGKVDSGWHFFLYFPNFLWIQLHNNFKNNYLKVPVGCSADNTGTPPASHRPRKLQAQGHSSGQPAGQAGLQALPGQRQGGVCVPEQSRGESGG